MFHVKQARWSLMSRSLNWTRNRAWTLRSPPGTHGSPSVSSTTLRTEPAVSWLSQIRRAESESPRRRSTSVPTWPWREREFWWSTLTRRETRRPGWASTIEIEPSIYDVLTADTPPAEAIRATGVANLHVLPSTIDLAGAEVELVSAMSRETRLRRALESIDHQYDTILIDCPPSLGLLTVNALAAADELLIPIQCEYYALEGLGQLLRNVELVRANLNPELRIGGIVLTMYDGRTRLALQVVDEVRKHFTDVVYQTVVPRSVRLSEAPGYGLPIALYDPLSRGGIAYRDLTFELAERSGLLAPTGEGAS